MHKTSVFICYLWNSCANLKYYGANSQHSFSVATLEYQEYKGSFREKMQEYEAWEKIYTDDSKSEIGVEQLLFGEEVLGKQLTRSNLPYLQRSYMADTLVTENANRNFFYSHEFTQCISLSTLPYKDTMAKQLQHREQRTAGGRNPSCLRLLSFHRTLGHRKRWTLESTETISSNTDKSMRKNEN